MLFYDIIAFFVNKDASGIIIGFKDNINSVKNFFLFIANLLFTFSSILGTFWTIYYFTPFHFITSEFISELLDYYIQLIRFKNGLKVNFQVIYENINNIIIFSVMFFINLIFSIIFNEIIILKFCKLEYYTKKYIKERADSDINTIFKEQESGNSQNEILDPNDNE